MLQNVLTLGAIVKKCKELLSGAEIVVLEGAKSWSIEEQNDGYGQTVYVIKDLNHKREPGKRSRGARIIIPPDGKVFGEWNVFKDENEILEFINY